MKIFALFAFVLSSAFALAAEPESHGYKCIIPDLNWKMEIDVTTDSGSIQFSDSELPEPYSIVGKGGNLELNLYILAGDRFGTVLVLVDLEPSTDDPEYPFGADVSLGKDVTVNAKCLEY